MKKILIIEDERTSVELLKHALSSTKCEILVAEDGETGVKMAQDTTPDLILLDMLLPKMDGFDVVKVLKRNEDLKNVPIIVITADEKSGDKFLKAGVNFYFTKPIEIQTVVQRIEEILTS